MLPPHTTASYSGVSSGASGSSKTMSRGGGSSPFRSFDQLSSSFNNAS